MNELEEYITNENITDIHIEQKKDRGVLRIRINGDLKEEKEFSKEEVQSVIAKIKVRSKLELDKKRICQDGSFNIKFQGKEYSIRVSSLPTIFGEKINLRILRNKSAYSLESLKFIPKDTLQLLLCANSGLLLIGGPTGSGKTTTLFNIINSIDTIGKNIITIEDPVEYIIPSANQVEVNEKANFTFSNILRSVLRQDPDIIVIGELRDEETVRLALRAALTGHLVISTIHCNDSYGAINRLVDMGIDKTLIKDTLIAVIYQRLLKKRCNCNSDPNCLICRGKGYDGKVVAGEYIVNDRYDLKNDLSKEYLCKNKISLRNYCKELLDRNIIPKEEYLSLLV
ncbi:ATPase, T2SS/T4P/T4SS family [uncultured Clostridium sp.]|uniref:GspE/PulE family protein n=1 Tax=uncultured Clostridium sp. TaxID=59620 RepID=UPI0025D727BD|nr:ATPase, T2SS/T4P/T4SS family [uncultured Clostridium sp.]